MDPETILFTRHSVSWLEILCKFFLVIHEEALE